MTKCSNCNIQENGQLVRLDVDGNCDECGRSFCATNEVVEPEKILVTNDPGIDCSSILKKLGGNYLVVFSPKAEKVFEVYEI